ncbi:hypothetical protein DL991_28715 [Amycolatopsis sp. WAC 01375]|uniref:hypothetical protein n=1 Tax=unclassified Amycolatopsis TaxID=2618356 RepID=UPI000F7A338A|nr:MULTISPECIES: hypothetical protein [unclassified Amycolatopsis]RSM74984.1 hypothetical protein DL991_28715 [Amycolatopsis sp. WAC 01375]RSN29543.1 hypothetical protein DL990_25470 [Amycolatopsis sp. WAC 01416]
MNTICRKFAGCLAVAVATLLPATLPAAAGEGVVPLSDGDLAAAVRVAGQPDAIGLARSNFRQVARIEPRRITMGEKGIPVYTLNPDFVRGITGAPAGVLRSVAVTATADSGQKATLQAMPEGAGKWVAASVFSGNDEETLSVRLKPGSVLLNEPQINGWYELGPDGVVLLQASLPQSPVGKFVPLSGYQREVHGRYADKLPGSDYQRDRGIGFRQAVPPPVDTGPPVAIVAGLIAAGVAGAGVVLVAVWRKRRLTPR